MPKAKFFLESVKNRLFLGASRILSQEFAGRENFQNFFIRICWSKNFLKKVKTVFSKNKAPPENLTMYLES